MTDTPNPTEVVEAYVKAVRASDLKGLRAVLADDAELLGVPTEGMESGHLKRRRRHRCLLRQAARRPWRRRSPSWPPNGGRRPRRCRNRRASPRLYCGGLRFFHDQKRQDHPPRGLRPPQTPEIGRPRTSRLAVSPPFHSAYTFASAIHPRASLEAYNIIEDVGNCAEVQTEMPIIADPSDLTLKGRVLPGHRGDQWDWAGDGHGAGVQRGEPARARARPAQGRSDGARHR